MGRKRFRRRGYLADELQIGRHEVHRFRIQVRFVAFDDDDGLVGKERIRAHLVSPSVLGKVDARVPNFMQGRIRERMQIAEALPVDGEGVTLAGAVERFARGTFIDVCRTGQAEVFAPRPFDVLGSRRLAAFMSPDASYAGIAGFRIACDRFEPCMGLEDDAGF